MNITQKFMAAAAVPVVALTMLGLAATSQAAPPTSPTPRVSAAVTLDAKTIENLGYMRQEEQLARDVYTVLGEKYPQAAPFTNIARAEQRHFDAVGRVLQYYGIDDPADGRGAGSYVDPKLQALYTELVAKGGESLQKAYEVGVTIETEDIADLKAAIAETSNEDVKMVFSNLLNGSEHHLAAFTAAKEGKSVGAQNGQGMRFGRARDGQAQGAGKGQGPGAGKGQGQGRQGDGQRRADCPFR